jgi:hypothetical protein
MTPDERQNAAGVSPVGLAGGGEPSPHRRFVRKVVDRAMSPAAPSALASDKRGGPEGRGIVV